MRVYFLPPSRRQFRVSSCSDISRLARRFPDRGCPRSGTLREIFSEVNREELGRQCSLVTIVGAQPVVDVEDVVVVFVIVTIVV